MQRGGGGLHTRKNKSSRSITAGGRRLWVWVYLREVGQPVNKARPIQGDRRGLPERSGKVVCREINRERQALCSDTWRKRRRRGGETAHRDRNDAI